MDFINKAWAYIGGKRGAAVIIGASTSLALYFGWITPTVAESIGAVAGVLGVAGVAHNAVKVNGQDGLPDPTSSLQP